VDLGAPEEKLLVVLLREARNIQQRQQVWLNIILLEDIFS